MMARAVLMTSISALALLASAPALAQDAAPPSGTTAQTATPSPAPSDTVAPTPEPQAADPEVTQTQPGAGTAIDADIVVTGSRITRRDYTSASPIVTTSEAALEASGQPNLEAAISQLPQFSGGRGSTTSSLGGGGFATVNLRGLGDNRNLVLLDGRRLPIATSSGVTDINTLPQSLIGGVEVISGGASAVYGSDAISGVVNFKSRELSGIEIDAQRNIAERGDAAIFDGSISVGSKFAEGRGRFFATGSYTDRDLLLGRDRTFYQRGGGSGSIPSGVVLLAGASPTQAAVDAVFARYGIAAGTVSRTSRFGFNNDGTLYAVTGGINLRDTTGRTGLLNNQVVYFNGLDTSIVTAQERYNAFAKASFEITPNIEVYAQGLYSHSSVQDNRAYPVTAPTNPTIPLTNPFIPADLRTLLASRATGTTQLFKAFQETGTRIYDYTFETYQALGGFRGSFGGGWKWDVYGSHDHTTLTENINHVVLLPRVQRLLNAADGGNSICAGGYNPFSEAGSATISQACLNYITAPTSSNTKISQNVVEATTNGTVFTLPAGEVKLAVTASYRDNSFRTNPDILLIPNYNYAGTAYSDLAGTLYPSSPTAGTNSITPASGKINVKEVAGELLVPLLSDTTFARSLNLTLGGRYSDYNLAGGATTYKAELDWRPVQMLLLRGGYEHAIRAPNVAELFGQQGTLATLGATPSGGDPCDIRTTARTGTNGANVLALCQAQFVAAGLTAAQAANALASYTYPATVVGSRITGNTTLDPEKADTFTVGGVLSPSFGGSFVRRATLSVDYYNIEVKDAISTVSGALALSKCFNLDGSNPTYSATNSYCSTIVRSSGTGILFDIGAPFLNIGGLKTSGLDIQLDTEFAITDGVRFALNSVVSHLFSYQVQQLPGAVFQEFGGTLTASTGATPPLPDWRALTTFTVSADAASLALRWRFIDAMRDVSSVTSTTPAAGVPSYNIFDLYGRIPVADRFELRAGVNNLFDKEAPVVGGVLSQTNASIYDILGRSFFVGMKVRF